MREVGVRDVLRTCRMLTYAERCGASAGDPTIVIPAGVKGKLRSIDIPSGPLERYVLREKYQLYEKMMETYLISVVNQLACPVLVIW